LLLLFYIIIIIMSTMRLLSDNFVQSFVRCLQWRHYFLLKSIGFLIVLISIINLAQNSSYHRHVPPFLSSKRDHVSLSPSFLQNLIITKLNLTEPTLAVPPIPTQSNYLDPFVYSRIHFTHNDEQRTEASRKWCQAQSKFIRPKILNLSNALISNNLNIVIMSFVKIHLYVILV